MIKIEFLKYYAMLLLCDKRKHMQKPTLDEIEARFDQDVERFSNIETGQATTLDARFNMELITDCITAVYTDKINVLDIGCGAGNYAVRLLQKVQAADVTLVDLSMPMLEKASERTIAENKGQVQIVKGDFRNVALPESGFDVIIATAVLHHLRDEQDWKDAFERLYRLIKPGGSLWVFDLVHQSENRLHEVIYHQRYGQYLTGLQDEAYQQKVFDYIEKEDSPRPLVYQLELLKEVGFQQVDVLHKNLCFASYVGFK